MSKVVTNWKLASLLAAGAMVASPSLAAPADEVDALRAQVEALKARESEALRKLDALEARLQALEQSRLSDTQTADMRGMGANSSLSAVRFGETVVLAQDAGGEGGEPDRKAPAPTAAVEDVTLQQQGITGRRFSLEAGLTYSYFDNARINLNGFLALDSIFLGRISIDQLRAHIITADLTARYGLTDRLQFDVNVPYLYRYSNFQSGGAGGAATSLTEKSVKDHGLGDISVGASYRILKETPGRPDVVFTARVKAPTGKHPFGVEVVEVEGSEGNLVIPTDLSTGSGVWGASLGVSALKTIDPLVVFGSATYFRNFKRKFDDIDEAEDKQPGTVKMGDAIQIGAGVAFALNERSSLSMSYSQRFVNRARIRPAGEDEQIIVGSQANIGLVNLGGTFALTDRISIISTVGIGLTEDAPSMVAGIRVPVRF
jgi:hypothetical protein